MAINLSAQAAASIELWQLYQVENLVARVQKNISLIDTPPNAQQITIIGGNLFQLAVQYYGDFTQWALIAQANGIFDPMLVGQNTLLIPPLNNQDTGGVVS